MSGRAEGKFGFFSGRKEIKNEKKFSGKSLGNLGGLENEQKRVGKE